MSILSRSIYINITTNQKKEGISSCSRACISWWRNYHLFFFLLYSYSFIFGIRTIITCVHLWKKNEAGWTPEWCDTSGSCYYYTHSIKNQIYRNHSATYDDICPLSGLLILSCLFLFVLLLNCIRDSHLAKIFMPTKNTPFGGDTPFESLLFFRLPAGRPFWRVRYIYRRVCHTFFFRVSSVHIEDVSHGCDSCPGDDDSIWPSEMKDCESDSPLFLIHFAVSFPRKNYI